MKIILKIIADIAIMSAGATIVLISQSFLLKDKFNGFILIFLFSALSIIILLCTLLINSLIKEEKTYYCNKKHCVDRELEQSKVVLTL